MAIDENQVRRLEQLAALRLADEERERLAGHLARVIAYVEQLRGLDTTGVAPLAHVVDVAAPRRADEPGEALPRAEALALSPARDPELFVVPPVFPGAGADDHG